MLLCLVHIEFPGGHSVARKHQRLGKLTVAAGRKLDGVEKIAAATMASERAVRTVLDDPDIRGNTLLKNAFNWLDKDGEFDPRRVGKRTAKESLNDAYLPAVALCANVSVSEARSRLKAVPGQTRVRNVFVGTWPSTEGWLKTATVEEALREHTKGVIFIANRTELSRAEVRERLEGNTGDTPVAQLFDFTWFDDEDENADDDPMDDDDDTEDDEAADDDDVSDIETTVTTPVPYQLTSLKKPERVLFWTAPVSDIGEMTTEDPLGLDYVAQQIGLLILPTLTTRSTRAQAYAMVLYGLSLTEQAVQKYGYTNTDEKKRELFEQWEKFWALATLEYRGGELPRGDWDGMRGVRGAKAAWKPSGDRLPLDFQLISRQQELGNLGAYLVPLRNSKLVVDGGIRPTPAALDIIDAFWDEEGDNQHRGRYEEYALTALEPGRTRIERMQTRLSLHAVGEKSRLLSLIQRNRREQQRRLHSALFEKAQDDTTRAVAHLVEAAARAGVTRPREILEATIAGRFGAVAPALHDLFITALAFGEYMRQMIGTFDRIYQAIDRGGWVVPHRDVVAAALTSKAHAALQRAALELLDAPCTGQIRRFPMHGAASLKLAEDIGRADATTTLDLLIAYHAGIQRERRRGFGWIRVDAGKLTLNVTSYTARPDVPRFPSYKLDAVRTLLTDMGRLPFVETENVAEVGS